MDITIYRGETVTQEIDLDGIDSPDFDITGAAPVFTAGIGGGDTLITASGTVVDATAGVVAVPISTDVDPGTYAWELEDTASGTVLAAGVLIIKPRIGSAPSVTITVGTDTYLTVDDADALLRLSLGVDAWWEASTDDRARALVTATRAIDALPLTGMKADYDQVLAFPRQYRLTPAVNPLYSDYLAGWDVFETVPDTVLEAVALEAAARLADRENVRGTLQAQGVRSVSIGAASESFGSASGLLSADALALMRRWTAHTAAIV